LVHVSLRVVWVYRQSRYVALLTTDLSLSVEQIIEFYSVRWKIEARFKEIKQETGSANSQARNADAVSNHLNFCMMVTTLIWIYADRFQNEPDRRREIRAKARVAFSDVRIIIADVALDPNFQSVCHRLTQTVQNSFIKRLLRMVS
jgi:hypothetical protein